jgi:ribosome-associated protein
MKSDGTNISFSKIKNQNFPAEILKTLDLIIDKKGEEIALLDIKGLSSVSDYFLICSGSSSTQNKAIAGWIQSQLGKTIHEKCFSLEGNSDGDWILIDYINFVVHIMSFDNRKKYQLEKLWMDAKRYNFIQD